MMRKAIFVLVFLLAFPIFAVGRYQSYVQKGGVKAQSGISGGQVTVVGSYPGSTVTVYNAGTLNLATIGSDSGMTPKANPFQASSVDAYFFFYAADGCYDLAFSGSGIAVPFTHSSVCINAADGTNYDALYVNVSGDTMTGSLGIGAAVSGSKLLVAGSEANNTLGAGNAAALKISNTDTGAVGRLAELQFGSAAATEYAAISGSLANAADNTTGAIVFSTRNTTTDANLTERMRISAGGLVGIGGASVGGRLLDITSTTATVSARVFANSTTTASQIELTTGNGTTSTRIALVDFIASETSQQYWRAGMNATKAFIVHNQTAGRTDLSISDTTGAATFSSSITERARPTPMGEWTSVAFAAGNFTASGSMTWTVESGDQLTLAYTLIGKTATVSFRIDTTTVGGTPSNTLFIALPFTITKSMFNACTVMDNGTWVAGQINALAGESRIWILRSDAGNFTASTNNTHVRGQITFEIN